MITRSCQFGDCFYWTLLPDYATCLCRMGAVALPTSPTEKRNQASPKPIERVIIKPCIVALREPATGMLVPACTGHSSGAVLILGRAEVAALPQRTTTRVTGHIAAVDLKHRMDLLCIFKPFSLRMPTTQI